MKVPVLPLYMTILLSLRENFTRSIAPGIWIMLKHTVTSTRYVNRGYRAIDISLISTSKACFLNTPQDTTSGDCCTREPFIGETDPVVLTVATGMYSMCSPYQPSL